MSDPNDYTEIAKSDLPENLLDDIARVALAIQTSTLTTITPSEAHRSFHRVLHALKDATERAEKAQNFVRDVAGHGVRFDLHPTSYVGPDVTRIHAWYLKYIERIDSSMRERADIILKNR